MSKLVGYKRFTSKKGERYCVAQVVSDFHRGILITGVVVLKLRKFFFLPKGLMN